MGPGSLLFPQALDIVSGEGMWVIISDRYEGPYPTVLRIETFQLNPPTQTINKLLIHTQIAM